MDGWIVRESGIKANSAQFSWSLADLGNITMHVSAESRLVQRFSYGDKKRSLKRTDGYLLILSELAISEKQNST